MIKRAIYSALISIAIVIVVILSGYFLVPCLSLHELLTAESARYVFSAVSQSMAAIFALTFVVIGWISSLAAKGLLKDVFRFIFMQIGSQITVLIFVNSILINIIYLGFTDNSKIGITSIGHYSYGLFASVLLFIISMLCLIWFAFKTYSVSLSPFGYFYDVVKKGIIPGLKTLESYIELGNSIRQLREQSKFQQSLQRVREYAKDQMVKCTGKEGFLTFVDINSIIKAHHLINNNSSSNRIIYYLVKIGEKIPRNAAVFSFEPVDPETDKRVKELLSKAYEINKNQPGWVGEFVYIDPLFKAVENEITDSTALKFYIEKLMDLANHDIKEKKSILGESEGSLQGFKCYWFLDRWFDRYYELIKQSCIVKGELARSGRLLDWKDEPDAYVIIYLQHLIVSLYRNNDFIHFMNATQQLSGYSRFVADIDKNSSKNIYFKQLEHIVENISWQAADREAPSSGFVEKLEQYVRYIVAEYLKTFKELIINDPTSYNVIFTKYNFLYKHFAKDIEKRRHEKEFSSQDLEALERIKILLLSMLFVIMVYVLKKVHEGIITNDIYIAFSRRFFGKYQRVYVNDEHWAGPLINFEKILDCSYDLLKNDLGWFGNLMEKEDIYDDSRPHPDTMVRDQEYCYYAFIFTLCLSEFNIKLDNWNPDKITTLQHFYKSLLELIKTEKVLNEILIAYCDDNIDKLKEILDKLEDLLGGNHS